MSSMAIYGNSKLPFKETMRPKPNSVYGISKVFGEMFTRKIQREWWGNILLPGYLTAMAHTKT